jgi:DNA-binding CsgD family transcriptional regulator
MPDNEIAEDSLLLKLLVLQMHESGYTQDQICAYLQKSKSTVNALLRPLQKKKGSKPRD